MVPNAVAREDGCSSVKWALPRNKKLLKAGQAVQAFISKQAPRTFDLLGPSPGQARAGQLSCAEDVFDTLILLASRMRYE
jgi:hypothetical protein